MTWRYALVLGLGTLTATQAAAADDLAAQLAVPVAGWLVGARDVPRFAWVENVGGVRNIQVATPHAQANAITAFTEDGGQQLSDLALTRDGATIAFVRGGDDEFPDAAPPNPAASATPPPQRIFVSSTGGGPSISIGEGHAPVFSNDGKRLAFLRKGEIWLWSPTSGTNRLATIAGEASRLEWSPDDTRLLFVDDRGDHSFIAVLDVADARLRYLDPGLGLAVEPTFSPDGRQVAYIRFVEPPAEAMPNGGPYWSIRVADIISGAARQLWAAPGGIGGTYYGTRGRNLFWSAGGGIVFPWERSGWLHAYALDRADGDARDLTPGAFEVESFLLTPTARRWSMPPMPATSTAGTYGGFRSTAAHACS